MLEKLQDPKFQRTCRLLIALAFVVGLVVYLVRVLNDAAGTDFPEFYAAGRHVLEHGARHPESLLHRYLPSVDVAWVLIAWMPFPMAAVVWYLINVGTWLGLLHSVDVHLLRPTQSEHRRIALLGAAGLTLVYALGHMMLGAFHLLMLWLMIAGVGRAVRGRSVSGGVLLGLGVWLKLLPLLGVVYLVLKRRWAAAVLAIGVAGMVDAGLTIAGLGLRPGWDAHVQWWHERGAGDLNELFHEDDFIAQQRDRNQAVPAVMRRILTQTGVEHPDEMYRHIAIDDLSGHQLRHIYFSYVGLMLTLVFLYWCRPARDLSAKRQAGEIGVLALATMWFSPIVFSYHPVAMIPAIAVIIAIERLGSPRGWIAVIASLAGMILLAFPYARALGEIQWVSWTLAVLIVIGTHEPPRRRSSEK